MEAITVGGLYDHGRVELDEVPAGIDRARLKVTFLPEENSAEPRPSDAERRIAIERMIARMRQGIDFAGEEFRREDIYQERMRELDERERR